MHLGSAGIGEADVNAARDQGPHQTFRTIHHSTPFAMLLEVPERDQSFLTCFVKGFGDIAAIAAGVGFPDHGVGKSQGLTCPWLAKPRQLWPVCEADFERGRI
jgi:hypothetical protein